MTLREISACLCLCRKRVLALRVYASWYDQVNARDADMDRALLSCDVTTRDILNYDMEVAVIVMLTNGAISCSWTNQDKEITFVC